MSIRQSSPTSRPSIDDNSYERLREQTIISVIVSNHLHDTRILDPINIAQAVGPFTLELLIDGDIPVRVEVKKECYGSAWITWHAWPNEPGRRTWGTMSVSRLHAAKAILVAGSYDRSRRRSQQLAKIPLPDAKWGLQSTECELFGIKSTF